MRLASDLPHISAEVLARLRERQPRVHCITNTVAQAFTANVLLAAGAVPSMTISPREVAEFVARADALLVNLGTLDAERREAIAVALAAAADKRLGWVLDPTFADRSPARAAFARELIGSRPAVVRLNHPEFAALGGQDAAPDMLVSFAQAHATVLALTGEVDRVADAGGSVGIANGDPLMAKITAMGCAASAVVAACQAVERDPWRATVAGLLIVGVAGEVAAERARGPGSLAVEILDALHLLDATTLLSRAKVS